MSERVPAVSPLIEPAGCLMDNVFVRTLRPVYFRLQYSTAHP
jgi:hypothetical protein